MYLKTNNSKIKKPNSRSAEKLPSGSSHDNRVTAPQPITRLSTPGRGKAWALLRNNTRRDSFPKGIVINYKVIGWGGEEIPRGLLDIDLETTQILQNAYCCYCPLVRVEGAGGYESQVINGILARIHFTVGSMTPNPFPSYFLSS